MTVYLPLRQSDRGVTRLDGPLGKKQVWRHHVRTSSLSAANILYLRKYLLHCWEFSAPPQWFGAGELCALAPPYYAHALRLHMSQIHCSGVMQWWACSSLMSAPLPYRGRLPNLRADCSTVGLYCVFVHSNKANIRFKLRYEAFCHMWLMNADILAGNAAR